ncbi:MAG: CotS family spore coat protein [Carboxydocellales bacterium]
MEGSNFPPGSGKTSLEGGQVAREVFSAFGLQVEGLAQSRTAIKVYTPNGNYALKQVTPEREKVRFTYRVIEYLRAQGFTAAVPLLTTKTGAILHLQGADGYILSPWIEGREANFKWGEDLLLAAELMGKMHLASLGFNLPDGEWSRNSLGQWPQQWIKALEELAGGLEELEKLAEQAEQIVQAEQVQQNNDQLPTVRTILSQLITQGRQALELLETKGSYRQQVEKAQHLGCLCHRDIVHHNLIIDSSNQIHLIDFEYCALELPVADVGRLLRKVLPGLGWDCSKLLPLLIVYHKVFPLTTYDRWLLLALLTFPHAWWRLLSRTQEGTWSATRLSHQLQSLIQEHQGRQLFLDELNRELS